VAPSVPATAAPGGAATAAPGGAATAAGFGRPRRQLRTPAAPDGASTEGEGQRRRARWLAVAEGEGQRRRTRWLDGRRVDGVGGTAAARARGGGGTHGGWRWRSGGGCAGSGRPRVAAWLQPAAESRRRRGREKLGSIWTPDSRGV
jgi:hypothetical protein